ncbi:MAG TPA: FGGY-family carbohydrate kinase [Rhizobiaceae bacterium]|nr:FGGY-family carbohydrate kinase [Rhizobiaceae bacterium]
MTPLVCAVDVGTGSARAGILDRRGKLIARATHPILINRPKRNFAEHDSEDIWRAVCTAVREACRTAAIDGRDVRGIGFDATCSLVVRNREGAPLPLSPGGENYWDTIAWFDHRALAEADECTRSGHAVLYTTGGVMSPEMQVPKLIWLKRNLPHLWKNAGYFFDLTDFLSWKASGSLARSQCTLACKWTYLAHEDGWRQDFFARMGVPDLIDCGRLPLHASPPGSFVGRLLPEAAQALGLSRECRVGAGLIDAYAGMLGTLGDLAGDGEAERSLALVGGTSSCLMAMTREPRRFPGVWGPYFGAVLPGLWVSEGGQSATGALLDHVVRWHGAGGEPDRTMHERIAGRIRALRSEEGEGFASRLHILPDFHGNRSPLADPHALGVVSGLPLDSSFDSLCRLYWRAAVAIALGIRHILDVQNERGYAADTLHVAGGHARNPLLMELYADATGCTVVEPTVEDATLLGTGMVAATAAGLYPDLASAAAGMGQRGRELRPDPQKRPAFDRDYRIFLEMQRQRQALDRME